jgi:hypothetical protein
MNEKIQGDAYFSADLISTMPNLRVEADRCACPSNETPTTSNLPRSQPMPFQT